MPNPFMTSQRDDVLLQMLNKGSKDAFTTIYERYHKLLYVLAYKYLKNKMAAEDAVQQVFIKLWEARSVLAIHINLRNYLYTMMKNYILNEIRNNLTALEKNYELAQSSPLYEDDFINRMEDAHMMDYFYQAIEQLPEQKKQVCLYKLKGNLTNQEIADKMNISVPTVKTHYAQAIKLLRKSFEKFILLFMIFSIF